MFLKVGVHSKYSDHSQWLDRHVNSLTEHKLITYDLYLYVYKTHQTEQTDDDNNHDRATVIFMYVFSWHCER